MQLSIVVSALPPKGGTTNAMNCKLLRVLRAFGDGDFDRFGVGLADGSFEAFAPFLEFLRAFPFQVEDVEENVIVPAGRTGVIEEADAFQGQPLPIGFHVFGFFLDEILSGKRAMAVAAFAVHDWSPLGF